MTRIILFLLITMVCCLPRPAAAQTDRELGARVDSLLQEAVQKEVFSGVVLITRNGLPVYLKAVGMADYAEKTPNTPATQFQIGSITKLFTKILILQLAAEKKLGTADKLGKYLDGFPPEMAEKISIEHLMDHRSGLGSYYEVGDFMNENRHAITGPADLLPWIRREQLQFEPGTDMAYSNSGYVLLAAIAERVTGKSYAELLRQYITGPLGMSATGFSAMVTPLEGKATGYLSNTPGTPPADHYALGIVGAGDGGIYSTASDLLRLHNSLLNDQRLLPNDRKLLIYSDLPGIAFDSWEKFTRGAVLALAGGAPGISAVYATDNPKNTAVLVLSNFDEGSAELLYREIRNILNNRKRAPLQLPPAKFIYSMLTEKGSAYFNANIDSALAENGYPTDDDMILYFAGQALIAENKIEAALTLYQYYTRKFPKIVVAWNDLGEVYLQKKDRENARKCFQKALELRPGNPRAQRNLEQLDKQ